MDTILTATPLASHRSLVLPEGLVGHVASPDLGYSRRMRLGKGRLHQWTRHPGQLSFERVKATRETSCG